MKFSLKLPSTKKLQKFFSCLSVFSLLLQLNANILLVSSAIAQEVTPTPAESDLTPTPIALETPVESPDLPDTPDLPDSPDQPDNPDTPDLPDSEPNHGAPAESDSELVEPNHGELVEPDLTQAPEIPQSGQLVPTPVEIQKVCLADGQEIAETVNEDWNINLDEDWSETKDPVKLGVRYIFPQENKVTVTFKCLPESGTTPLKIQKVKVADLKLPEGVTPSGEYAFDITTGMTDGTFEYDVTLPKPEGETAEVSYIEKSTDDAKSNEVKVDEIKLIEEAKTEQSNDTVKVTAIDHFTIFIVTPYTNPSGTAPTLTTATVNNQTSVTVQPGENITINLTVNTSSWHDDYDDWRSTEYRLNNNEDWQCVDTADYEGDGTYSNSFTILAPATAGTYDLDLRAYNLAGCGGNSWQRSGIYEMNNAITVNIPAPTVCNDPSDDYSLNSSTGIWIDVDGGSNVNGEDTNEIRWGTTQGEQSGLRFDAVGVQTFDENTKFLLGTLTHMNWPIGGGSGANGATLQITLSFSEPGILPNPAFTFDFDIEETPNNGNCAYGGNCNDRITFPASYGTQVFTIGDIQYTLVIDGFVNSYTCGSIGSPVNEFITEEEKNNTAYLVGHLSSVLVEAPAISITKKTNDTDVTEAPGPTLNVGDTVTWQYVVQNTGNVPLTNVYVEDNPSVIVTCPLADPLTPGTAITCNASGTVVAGQFSNTATAYGTHSGGTVTDSDTSWYNGVVSQGRIIIDKVTIPSGDSQSFTFTPSYGNSFNLTDGETPQDSGDLNTGTYTVTETTSADWKLTSVVCDDQNSLGDRSTATATINLDAGETVTCTFTNTKKGKINVHKFMDKNANGVKDGTDFGYQWGVFMELFPNDDCSGSRINQGNTNSSGNIAFSNLVPGEYSVKETVPNTYKNSTPVCQSVTVGAGEEKQLNFGNYPLRNIFGTKYNDLNGNGVKDSGEPALAGWTFNLVGLNNGYNQSLVTNADGYVNFQNLDYGTYILSEVQEAGWFETVPVGGRNYTYIVNYDNTYPAGSMGFKVTNFQYGSISGYKFKDIDGDGVWGQNEPEIEGWTIFIDANNNGQLDAGERTTTTDDDGYYEFDQLTYGTYVIREVLQTGLIQTTTNPVDILIQSGTNVTDVNFGNQQVYANIDISKSDDADPVSLGNIITYTINWSLSSNVSLNNVYIDDIFASFPSSDLIDDNWVQNNNPGWTQTNPWAYKYSLGNFGPGNHSGTVEIKLKVVDAKPASVSLPANIENYAQLVGTKSTGGDVSDFYTEYTQVRPPVTIKAHKVVCDSEADLPNWGGTNGSGINASTAQAFIDGSNGKCHWSEEPWDFQWGFQDKTGTKGVDKLTGDHIGPADGTPSTCGESSNCGSNTDTGTGYNDWKGFSTSANGGTPAEVAISDLEDAPGIWVRENLKEDYVPFTYPPKGGTEDNVSAEIYCHNDRYKYDNYDLVESPVYGQTYYCVAFNAPATSEVKVCKKDESGAPLAGWNVRLLGEKVGEPITVLPNGVEVFSADLPLGDYALVASGLYKYRNGNPAGDGHYYTDPNYSERAEGDALPHGDSWPWFNVNDFPAPHVGWLGIMVDGSPTNWSSYYNPGHVYSRGYVGKSGTFGFQILDDYYADNTGSLTVDIYKGYAGTTGADGCATFTGVPFGDYTVDEVLRANWENVSGIGTVTVDEASEEFTLVNRLQFIPGDLFVEKYEDLDGVLGRSGDESLIGDPTFTFRVYEATPGGWLLKDQRDTDASGQAAFIDVFDSIGEYFVCEVQKDGWADMRSLNNSANNLSGAPDEYPTCEGITVPGSDYVRYAEFGNARLGSIAGRKYIDNNGDGQYVSDDGDTLYAGWTIKLYKDNGAGWDYLTEVLTDGNGDYLFDNLEAGSYRIAEDLDASYIATDPNEFGLYNAVNLSAGQNLTGFDFGNFEKGDLYVNKYEDTDGVLGRSGDETWIGDPTFSFRVYKVTDSGWVLQGSADTDTEGRATFLDIFDEVGSYYVCEVRKDGWEDMRSLFNDDNNLSGELDEYPTCEGITVSESGYGVYPEFGNIHLGQVTVYKFEDLDGNGTHDQGEPFLPDWDIVMSQVGGADFTQKTDESGKTVFDLNPADYILSETLQTGWEQTGIYCGDQAAGDLITSPGEAYGHHGNCEGWNGCGDAATCAQWACEVNGYSYLVSYGDQRPCTQFNNCHLFADRSPGYPYDSFINGHYIDWDWGNSCDVMGVTDIYCSDGAVLPAVAAPQIVQDSDSLGLTVLPGDQTACYIGNVQYGDITVCKYDDLDGDGEQDASEPAMPGVTMVLEQPVSGEPALSPTPTNPPNDPVGFNLVGSVLAQVDQWEEVDRKETGQDGCVTFEDFLAGRYRVSEELADMPGYLPSGEGDEVADGVRELEVLPGQTQTVDFLNELQPLVLTLTKARTSDTNVPPGTVVTYSITVTNDGDHPAYGVQVKEVLPDGFTYKADSTTGDAGEPSINGQELVWTVGDISAGGSRTINFQTDTDSGLQPYLYPGPAVAWGWNRPEGEESRDLAYTDFATAWVQLVRTPSASTDIEPRTEEVLGAATEGQVLSAATGANTRWLIAAIFMIVSGLAILFRKKFKKILGLAALLALVLAPGVRAADLAVWIADLPDYTKEDYLKISYSAIQKEGAAVEVRCYLEKDGGFAWRQFDDTKTAISGSCDTDSADFDGDGEYRFKAVAVSGSESAESNIASVKLDRSGIGEPRDYSKSRESTTSFKLHWRAPDDDQFSFVRVYASKDRDFTADDGTKRGDYGSAPDQEMIQVLTGFDENVEYFFALQAFDKAGNGSGLVGDGGSVTTTTYEATPASGSVLGTSGEGAAGQTGQVLGGESTAQDESGEEGQDDEIAAEEGEDGESTIGGIADAFTGEKKGWFWLVGALIVGGLGYFFFFRDRKPSQ